MSSPTSPTCRRILSGVQPSGKLHLGNYFGAIRQHVELQAQGDSFYFIADYHALTSIRDTARTLGEGGKKPLRPGDLLRQFTFDVALDYLALGLDPNHATFFRQSDVPEVCELAWILSTVTNMGLLERAHSYKDKVDKGIEASVGLFTYPALMAADIIIYRSHLVPVGQDQVQHLEMTRDMADRFNRAFDREVFPLPDYRLTPTSKVPGIDGQKMSKSYGNTIDIFAEGNALRKPVMSIVTDSLTVEDKKDPEKCTIFALYSLFAGPEEREALAERYRAGGMGYGDAKKMLLAKINETFEPARERRKQLAARPDDVEDVLRRGAARARHVAQETMALVREAVGMLPRPVVYVAPQPLPREELQVKIRQAAFPLTLADVVKGLKRPDNSTLEDFEAAIRETLAEEVRHGRAFVHPSGKNNEPRYWNKDEKRVLEDRAYEIAVEPLPLAKLKTGLIKAIKGVNGTFVAEVIQELVLANVLFAYPGKGQLHSVKAPPPPLEQEQNRKAVEKLRAEVRRLAEVTGEPVDRVLHAVSEPLLPAK